LKLSAYTFDFAFISESLLGGEIQPVSGSAWCGAVDFQSMTHCRDAARPDHIAV